MSTSIDEALSATVTTRELRSNLADVMGRVAYGQERIGITRNGKLSAVIVSVEDVEDLEAYEMMLDAQAVREAMAEDDGVRIPWEQVREELGA